MDALILEPWMILLFFSLLLLGQLLMGCLAIGKQIGKKSGHTLGFDAGFSAGFESGQQPLKVENALLKQQVQNQQQTARATAQVQSRFAATATANL